jgi:tetratricopeptide (TPR) repeat protein
MKQIILIFSLFLSVLGTSAQTATDLVNEGLALETKFKSNEALAKYEAALKLEPTNIKALHKASLLLSQIGEQQTTNAAKTGYYNKAASYSELCMKTDPREADGYFTMAVALGKKSLIASSEEKLKYASQIKKLCELAIKFDPNHAGANHILGRLNREIANMSSIKVMAAKALYGGVPEGCSFENAEKYFSRAMQLRPKYVLYYYDAALNYKYLGDKTKAKELLTQAIAFPNQSAEDDQRKADCKKLLGEL